MRAIIVDDSRATRMILRRLVAELGFEVCEAGHGAEALSVLADVGPVDLALVDWNMPEMNGLELVRALRADPSQAGCRIVMVTTESDIDRMVEALDAGANEYAMKPFDREVILGKLRLLGLAAERVSG
jgi:two-component system, chemotaxis family, chemotaxis protein CheY